MQSGSAGDQQRAVVQERSDPILGELRRPLDVLREAAFRQLDPRRAGARHALERRRGALPGGGGGPGGRLRAEQTRPTLGSEAAGMRPRCGGRPPRTAPGTRDDTSTETTSLATRGRRGLPLTHGGAPVLSIWGMSTQRASSQQPATDSSLISRGVLGARGCKEGISSKRWRQHRCSRSSRTRPFHRARSATARCAACARRIPPGLAQRAGTG